MITSKTAIDKAVASFLESLGTDYLGGDPKNFRVETHSTFSVSEWVKSSSAIQYPSSETEKNLSNQFVGGTLYAPLF